MRKQAERLSFIMQELELRGAISVSEISRMLDVSVVTARKDLQVLESQKLLIRVNGGAVPNGSGVKGKQEPGVPLTENMELKQLVAEEAAQLIQSGDSLIVTSGATPHLTVRCAEACTNLKIVTDSLAIAEDLCHRPDYQVIILGGDIYQKDFFVHGRDAVRQAERYMADKAILTMDGVDPGAGLTTLRVEGVDTLKAILARSRMRIIVADITKIGKECFCQVGDLSVVDVLVTNWTEDVHKLEILKRISDMGVQVKFAKT